jgi:signal transduction histidine kinase
LRHLYREREQVALAAMVALAAAALIGAVFVRIISRPMRDLVRRAEAIGRGQREAIGSLAHYGTRELAGLAHSFMNMARRLFDRSEYLSTFASHVSHELKTPLTSIRGAAELMLDPAMADDQRRKFLANVLCDAERMSGLLDRLRDLARAENAEIGGATTLEEAALALRERFPEIEIETSVEASEQRDPRAEAPIAMSQENAGIVLGHLVDNARRHGARRVRIAARPAPGRLVVTVIDDGAGVSPGNRARIFDAFFTTRRAEGGAGMGLHIVRSMLRAHGGDIRLVAPLGPEQRGAAFEFWLPAKIESPPRRFQWRDALLTTLQRIGIRHARSTYRSAADGGRRDDIVGNSSARTDASRP